MKYSGSCHCGAIKFEAEGEIKGALDCNCSICSRKATLLWFVPKTNFHLLTPEDKIATYTFNKHIINHKFCQVCGVQPFSEAVDPKGVPTIAVNIRCLEGVDISGIPVKHYDGKSV